MDVACIQLEMRPGEDKPQRVDRASKMLECLDAVDLVVLPELWAVGYFGFDRYAAEAEELDGPTVTALSGAARRLGAWVHAGSIVERDADRLYNTSVLLDPTGDVAAVYRKFHLFGYRSREAELLTPGDRIGLMSTPHATLGLTTCYDLRFPELFRVLCADGAEIACVVAAWPAERVEHWRLLVRTRALENLFAVVACNASGTGDGVALAGHSIVVDPWGVVLAEATEREEILRATIDVPAIAKLRGEFPVLDDQRLGTARP